MSVFVNDNGVLRTIIRAFANDNGVLREFGVLYANDNGVLRTVGIRLVDLNTQYDAEDVEIFPTDALCRLEVNTNGTIRHHENGVLTTINTWRLFGASADYDCRLSVNSGTSPNAGDALATWLNCSVTRSWDLVFTANGFFTNNCTLELRLAGAAVLDSAVVTMYAESQP